MIGFESLFETSKDGDRILNRRFVDHNGLETSFQSPIFLDVESIFVKGGRADAINLAAGEHWFKHVGGVERTIGAPCADDKVNLIDEEDDFAIALLNLIKDGFESLFEFAAILSPGDKRAHI